VFALKRKLEPMLRDAILLRSSFSFDLHYAENKRKDIPGRATLFSRDRYPRRGSGPRWKRLSGISKIRKTQIFAKKPSLTLLRESSV